MSKNLVKKVSFFLRQIKITKRSLDPYDKKKKKEGYNRLCRFYVKLAVSVGIFINQLLVVDFRWKKSFQSITNPQSGGIFGGPSREYITSWASSSRAKYVSEEKILFKLVQNFGFHRLDWRQSRKSKNIRLSVSTMTQKVVNRFRSHFLPQSK